MRLTVLLVAALLAGCADVEPTDDTPVVVDERTMVIRGVVATPDLSPLAGANVTVEELNLTELTAPDGSFAFPPLPFDFYTVTADAVDFLGRSITVSPGANESLIFSLEALREAPSSESVVYEGRLECAAEYIIISGSCDRVSTEFNGPAAFDELSQFLHDVSTNWRTVVVDVVFDEANLQGFEGIRVSTKAGDSADELGSYERYARHAGSSSFTFRITPGEVYEDGGLPVPQNATGLLFDVFAQGNGYGMVCVPENSPERPGECFTGIGAGIDIKFELYVTTFYVEPAPEGFTLQ